MRARCLFLWWVNAGVGVGQARGLAGAVCYRESPGPPGVPSCWPGSEGPSLRYRARVSRSPLAQGWVRGQQTGESRKRPEED